MAASCFAFFRGGAALLAHDLSSTPVSCLQAQLCGDAHLANFGSCTSPEGCLAFDIRDFGQTLPGPWEWDLKRLAASFILSGRHQGLGAKESRKVASRAVRAYQEAMKRLSRVSQAVVWHHLVNPEEALDRVKNKKARKAGQAWIQVAKARHGLFALEGLVDEDEDEDERRIRDGSGLLIPARELARRLGANSQRELAEQLYDDYLRSVPDHVAYLLGKLRLVDIAVKLAGVESVGARCFVLLLESDDAPGPLFLQLQEAGRSVLEDHLPSSSYALAARRVVEGQRLMQTVSDIFLGWFESDFSGNSYCVRRLEAFESAPQFDDTSGEALRYHAALCGWTLAKAHARSGDPVAISSYVGSQDRFRKAIVAFADQYADQSQRDYEAYLDAIGKRGLAAAELD